MPRGRPKGPIVANEHQVLHERLRWLRQTQKPYMTQEQLAHASSVSLSFIQAYEKGHITNMSTETIKKLAAALGCTATIRLIRVSNREIMDTPPSGPSLPFAPKRTGKTTVEARTRALSRERSPWLVARQKRLEKLHRLTAETEDYPSGQEN